METWFPHPRRVHYRRRCQLVRDQQRGRVCQPGKAKDQWILLLMKSFQSRFTNSEIFKGTCIQMAFLFCGKVRALTLGKVVIVINYLPWKILKLKEEPTRIKISPSAIGGSRLWNWWCPWWTQWKIALIYDYQAWIVSLSLDRQRCHKWRHHIF